MRLATTANEAYTASLAVSELLGCKQCGGGRGQDEVPGRGAGRAGGYRAELPGLPRDRDASRPPYRTAAENASQGGRPWSNRPAGRAARRGRLGLAGAPQVKGRPVVGGETVSMASRARAENAEAGSDSCLGPLNGSLRNVNNVVFCASLHKSEPNKALVLR